MHPHALITNASFQRKKVFTIAKNLINAAMTVRVLLAISSVVAAFACTQAVDVLTDGTPIAPVPAPTNTAAAPQGAPTSVPQKSSGEAAEVLVLGDSQISFGAGAAYTAFFENLAQNCGAVPAGFESADAAAIGVRSTALQHWTARSGAARGVICDVDPTYGVNAGSYGVTSTGRSYVQIGADPNYPFCPANRSPLEAVFDTPAFDPDLLVFAFLGNATDRWQTPATARSDWQAVTAQLPQDVPCIVMTTLPSFEAEVNDRRARAQDNLAAAVAGDGTCAFVPGFTPATRRAIEGNAAFFRTNDAGVVTDPGHPTTASAFRFMEIQKAAICAAVTQVLQN